MRKPSIKQALDMVRLSRSRAKAVGHAELDLQDLRGWIDEVFISEEQERLASDPAEAERLRKCTQHLIRQGDAAHRDLLESIDDLAFLGLHATAESFLNDLRAICLKALLGDLPA